MTEAQVGFAVGILIAVPLTVCVAWLVQVARERALVRALRSPDAPWSVCALLRAWGVEEFFLRQLRGEELEEEIFADALRAHRRALEALHDLARECCVPSGLSARGGSYVSPLRPVQRTWSRWAPAQRPGRWS